MTDRERVAAAYERSSSRQNETGGGFLVEDALSGGFMSRNVSGEGDDTLLVKDLPEALRRAGLRGSTFQEVQDLLEGSAESSTSGDHMVIPKTFFIQAVEAALDVPEDAPHRSKQRLRLQDAETSDMDEDDISSNDEFRIDEQDAESLDESDDMERLDSNTSKRLPRTRLSASKRARAETLFRLILERLPLSSSEQLSKYDQNSIRPDVSDKELHSRRIGVDELRFVAQSLKESPSTSELLEMLSEATRIYPETGDTKQTASVCSDIHRIGLPECVDLPLTQIHSCCVEGGGP